MNLTHQNYNSHTGKANLFFSFLSVAILNQPATYFVTCFVKCLCITKGICNKFVTPNKKQVWKVAWTPCG